MHPRISVVIACFNQAKELELVLTSFLQQEIEFSAYELIVIDDHSPDYAARDVVAEARRSHSNANLLYVRNYRTDGGSYGASARVKNIGIRLARGDYVFFNNAEIAQAGESLSHILKTMDLAGKPLCLRGRVIDLPHEQLAGRTQRQLEAIHDRADRSWERVATNDHAGLAAVPRELLLEIGGIDERFDYWGKEDLDLAARLKRAGCTYVYDENLKSFHISHPPNHVKEGDYRRMICLLDENNSQEVVCANVGHLWGTLAPPPADRLDGTLIVEAGSDGDDLTRRLEQAIYSAGSERYEVIVVCRETVRREVEAIVGPRFRPLQIISLAPDDPSSHASRVLRHVRTRTAAFLPEGASFTSPDWQGPDQTESALQPWVAEFPYSRHSAKSYDLNPRSWLGSTRLLRYALEFGGIEDWTLVNIAKAASNQGRTVRWPSPRLSWIADIEEVSTRGPRAIGMRSTVLALVPHYRCEEWLAECLESLVWQTRPLDGIAVIDDNSEQPPLEIVRRFPQVTLLAASETVGPYRLVQTVISRTAYDAYLFQDADDWSACDRLELLLEEAERTGAELIGSQELRVSAEGGRVSAVCYPLDVSKALSEREAHPVLHPTTLISRNLVERSGGFSTALRFGADSELLLRAGYIARVVNIPRYCYFRRERPHSLTSAPDTGLQSAAREKLMSDLREWAERTRESRRKGSIRPVPPFAAAGPVHLEHLAGPALTPHSTNTQQVRKGRV